MLTTRTRPRFTFEALERREMLSITGVSDDWRAEVDYSAMEDTPFWVQGLYADVMDHAAGKEGMVRDAFTPEHDFGDVTDDGQIHVVFNTTLTREELATLDVDFSQCSINDTTKFTGDETVVRSLQVGGPVNIQDLPALEKAIGEGRHASYGGGGETFGISKDTAKYQNGHKGLWNIDSEIDSTWSMWGGNGVTVGVISDSYKYTIDAADYTHLQATANVIPDDAYITIADEGSGANDLDEGRAMVELMYPSMPSASYVFHEFGNSPSDMAAAIEELADTRGCDVIVDDVGWPPEQIPFFHADSNDTDTVQGAMSANDDAEDCIFVSAVGNQGTGYITSEANYTSSVTLFDGVDEVTGEFQKFNHGLTSEGEFDYFVKVEGIQEGDNDGSTLNYVYFEWDQQWDHAYSTVYDTHEVYLATYDSGSDDWTVLGSATATGGLSENQIEFGWYETDNNGGSIDYAGEYYIAVERTGTGTHASRIAPSQMVFTFKSDLGWAAHPRVIEGTGTAEKWATQDEVWIHGYHGGHNQSPQTISVGAVNNSSNTYTLPTQCTAGQSYMENYSSGGYSEGTLSATGTRLATPVKAGVDVVAADGVLLYYNDVDGDDDGQYDAGEEMYPNATNWHQYGFYGSSAAAPQVAVLAACIGEEIDDFVGAGGDLDGVTWEELRESILMSALDLGGTADDFDEGTGWDEEYGWGLISGATALACALTFDDGSYDDTLKYTGDGTTEYFTIRTDNQDGDGQVGWMEFHKLDAPTATSVPHFWLAMNKDVPGLALDMGGNPDKANVYRLEPTWDGTISIDGGTGSNTLAVWDSEADDYATLAWDSSDATLFDLYAGATYSGNIATGTYSSNTGYHIDAENFGDVDVDFDDGDYSDGEDRLDTSSSSGDDTVSLNATTARIDVNCSGSYAWDVFDADDLEMGNFQETTGTGSGDALTITGTTGTDYIWGHCAGATIAGQDGYSATGYLWQASHDGTGKGWIDVDIDGEGSTDLVRLYDSTDDDTFVLGAGTADVDYGSSQTYRTATLDVVDVYSIYAYGSIGLYTDTDDITFNHKSGVYDVGFFDVHTVSTVEYPDVILNRVTNYYNRAQYGWEDITVNYGGDDGYDDRFYLTATDDDDLAVVGRTYRDIHFDLLDGVVDLDLTGLYYLDWVDADGNGGSDLEISGDEDFLLSFTDWD